MQKSTLKGSLKYLHEELEEHLDLIKELKNSNKSLSEASKGQLNLCRKSFETASKLEESFERFKGHITHEVQGLDTQVCDLRLENQQLLQRLARLELAHQTLVAKVLIPAAGNSLRVSDLEPKPEPKPEKSTSISNNPFASF